MKKVSLVLLSLMVAVCFLPNCSSAPEKQGLAMFFPEKSEAGDWNPVDTVQVFVGQDLYELINGGAEIYHEYGFNRVAAREYTNGDKSIMVELFEMTDALSTYGMYSFKTGKSGEDVSVGNEGLLSDYYLNFREGKYLVTVTGYDSETATVQGLIRVSNEIAERIKGIEDVPEDMLAMLEPEGLVERSVVYIEGPLALQNTYHFGGDIFGVTEGIIGDYGSYYQIFIKYPGEVERKEGFKKVKESLRNSPILKTYSEAKDFCTAIDKKDRRIKITEWGNTLSITISKAK